MPRVGRHGLRTEARPGAAGDRAPAPQRVVARMSEALFRLFETLPRQGPGSDACTREALRRLPALPAAPRVLDLGCGAGASTLVLAATLRTRVIAVDIHQPFLDQLRATAQARGLAPLIETRCADMRAPGVPPGSVDLLWSEGALYLLGFEQGLRLWRPLLAPGGCLVVSECSWLCAEPPAEAAAFFGAGYPGMAGIGENLERARAAGFDVDRPFHAAVGGLVGRVLHAAARAHGAAARRMPILSSPP